MSEVRLIDANKLIKTLEEMANDEWNQQVGSSKGLEDAIDVIENTSTVEQPNYAMDYQDGVRKVLKEVEEGKHRPKGEWISRSALIKAIENEQIQWNRNTESDCARWDECESIMALINRIPTAEEKEK